MELQNLELTFSVDKINRLGKRIDFNIFYQMLLIILGILTLVKPELLNDFTLIFTYDIALANLIIPALLVYFFVLFGYMLYNYHELRKLVDLKANAIYQNDSEGIQRLYDIFRESRIIETVYIYLKKNDIVKLNMENDLGIPTFKLSIFPFWSYSIMSIISLNHSLVLCFIIANNEVLGLVWTIILLIISILTFAGCYREYILLTKNKNFVKFTIFNTIFTTLLVVLYLIFLDT